MTGSIAQRSFCGSAFILVAALVCVDSAARGLARTEVTTVLEAIDEYRAGKEAHIIRDFVELLSIPNVASNLPDMERNAEIGRAHV